MPEVEDEGRQRLDQLAMRSGWLERSRRKASSGKTNTKTPSQRKTCSATTMTILAKILEAEDNPKGRENT
jgi:hypothetical protein